MYSVFKKHMSLTNSKFTVYLYSAVESVLWDQFKKCAAKTASFQSCICTHFKMFTMGKKLLENIIRLINQNISLLKVMQQFCPSPYNKK